MITENVISLIAPHDCVTCGAEGSLLCAWCFESAINPLPSRCYRCHMLTKDSSTCQKCRRVSNLKHVWVVGEYADTAKILIHKLKFERARAAAEVVAELMDQVLPHIPSEVIITYAPTSTTRRRQRGYDQSELIARLLAKRRSMPFKPILGRYGQSRQVGAGKLTRLEQLNQAFYTRVTKSELKEAKILLIDDIVTTGGTLESAAGALKRSGAKVVYGAAFAQKR